MEKRTTDLYGFTLDNLSEFGSAFGAWAILLDFLILGPLLEHFGLPLYVFALMVLFQPLMVSLLLSHF